MSAAVLVALPSGPRAGAAGISFAFFPFVRLWLAGEKLGWRGFPMPLQGRRYVGQRPGREFAGQAPVANDIALTTELTAEGGISA